MNKKLDRALNSALLDLEDMEDIALKQEIKVIIRALCQEYEAIFQKTFNVLEDKIRKALYEYDKGD